MAGTILTLYSHLIPAVEIHHHMWTGAIFTLCSHLIPVVEIHHHIWTDGWYYFDTLFPSYPCGRNPPPHVGWCYIYTVFPSYPCGRNPPPHVDRWLVLF